MKKITISFIFINLLYYSLSKENIACDYISTVSKTYKKLSECRTYDVEEISNAVLQFFQLWEQILIIANLLTNLQLKKIYQQKWINK